MPFYQCVVPAGKLDTETRAALAAAITEVHADITGAPRGFVNVAFTEYAPGSYFTAGRPNDGTVISGGIRAGRDRETRARLLSGLANAWTTITGDDVRKVLIGLAEIDPTSTMEAGLIMPAPGEEAAWLEAHGEQLGELLSTT